jgi:hypothetical protein
VSAAATFRQSTLGTGANAVPVTLYDPKTGAPIAGNESCQRHHADLADRAGAAELLSAAEYSDERAGVQLPDDLERRQ